MRLQTLAAGKNRIAHPMVSRYPELSRTLVAASLCAACSSSVEPISVERDCPTQPFRGPALYAGEPPHERQLLPVSRTEEFCETRQVLDRAGAIR